jgi:phospholipid/cholesterol/gamma-HCH transport system permease protein
MERRLTFEQARGETLLLKLSSDWKLGNDLPSAADVQQRLSSEPAVRRVVFNTDALEAWDTSLLIFLTHIRELCRLKKIHMESDGLPMGAKRLLVLASAVPEQKDTGKVPLREPLIARIGIQTVEALTASKDMLTFIGELTVSFGKFLVGRACFRRSDLLLIIQQCGADALPIVSLISVLIGLILAFVGSVQLKLFGAEIYIASLVAIGMTREMGAMMTAVIMAGRTGAAFAAQLGTMQVNEEIDSLTTSYCFPGPKQQR